MGRGGRVTHASAVRWSHHPLTLKSHACVSYDHNFTQALVDVYLMHGWLDSVSSELQLGNNTDKPGWWVCEATRWRRLLSCPAPLPYEDV